MTSASRTSQSTSSSRGCRRRWRGRRSTSHPRTAPPSAPSRTATRLAALTQRETAWLTLLLDHLGDAADLERVTALVYGVPKLARGLAVDDPPTDEVKADQKDFFRLLYQLLVDADRGPRLPTLVMALGADKVRSLLTP